MEQDLNLDDRLRAAITLRDSLAAEAQRVQGKKEAAESTLETVEAEVRAAKLDPDTLDSTISQLEDAYATAVELLETEVQSAASALAPYIKDPS